MFKIHADGASDTFGMTIGQVSLYNVLGQVRRVEKDKEIICYDRKWNLWFIPLLIILIQFYVFTHKS